MEQVGGLHVVRNVQILFAVPVQVHDPDREPVPPGRLRQPHGSAGNGKPADDVVEADYEIVDDKK